MEESTYDPSAWFLENAHVLLSGGGGGAGFFTFGRTVIGGKIFFYYEKYNEFSVISNKL